MGANDFVAQLSAKPLGYKLGVLGGIVVLLGGLYWQLFYSGLSDDLQNERNQTKTLEQKQNKLKKDLAEWNELVLQKKALDEELKKNAVSLPASSELPSFFVHLQKQAAGAGVKLDNWKRLKESPIESYIKVPVAIQVTGTFYQINNYFKLLYETDRIITVEDMALAYQSTTNEDVNLVARFTASTFRLPDRPPDTNLPATLEPKPKPKGGKAVIRDANDKRGKQLDSAAGTKTPKPKPEAGGDKPKPGADKKPAGGAK